MSNNNPRSNFKKWKTADGQEIRICDMTDEHLVNAIRCLVRKAKGDLPDIHNDLVREARRRKIQVNPEIRSPCEMCGDSGFVGPHPGPYTKDDPGANPCPKCKEAGKEPLSSAEFVKRFRATCEVAYRDCNISEQQVKNVLKNTGVLGLRVRLLDGSSAAKMGLEALTIITDQAESYRIVKESFIAADDVVTERDKTIEEQAKELKEISQAVKVRIAFIGHPNEPMNEAGPDWSKEVALLDRASKG